jgi:hypothetical protein
MVWIGLIALVALGSRPGATGAQDMEWDAPAAFDRRAYVIYRAPGAVTVDGRLNERAWQRAAWTAPFVDARGGDRPAPRFTTRAKMLWDEEALYVAAELEEPDVWATFTEREAPIFRDNAFEVFIDPDGDTHNYYEFEINALGTVWDLMMIRPYRDGGPAISAWDIRGLEAAVQVNGTLNDPSDTDAGWTVELALPWAILEEAAPGGEPPSAGAQWRFNLARAQWPTTVVDGTYEKKADPATGEPRADWWLWSPHGVINMHQPERYGIVQFADVPVGSPSVSIMDDANAPVRWALRRLYDRQRQYHAAHGRYASSLAALDAADITLDGRAFEPTLRTTQSMYEITAPGAAGDTVHIRHDGKVWVTH